MVGDTMVGAIRIEAEIHHGASGVRMIRRINHEVVLVSMKEDNSPHAIDSLHNVVVQTNTIQHQITMSADAYQILHSVKEETQHHTIPDPMAIIKTVIKDNPIVPTSSSKDIITENNRQNHYLPLSNMMILEWPSSIA